MLKEPLRYKAAGIRGDDGELGFLKLRYKESGQAVQLMRLAQSLSGQ